MEEGDETEPTEAEIELKVQELLAEAINKQPDVILTMDLILEQRYSPEVMKALPEAERLAVARHLTNVRLDRLAICSLGRSVLQGMPHLTNLYLQYNRLTDCAALAYVTSLRFVTLAGNQLSEVSGVSALPSLMFLDVSHNIITDLPLAVLPTSLRFLQVTGNMCDSAATRTQLLAHLPHLRDLDGEVTRTQRREAKQAVGMPLLPADEAQDDDDEEEDGEEEDEDDLPERPTRNGTHSDPLEGSNSNWLGMLEDLERKCMALSAAALRGSATGIAMRASTPDALTSRGSRPGTASSTASSTTAATNLSHQQSSGSRPPSATALDGSPVAPRFPTLKQPLPLPPSLSSPRSAAAVAAGDELASPAAAAPRGLRQTPSSLRRVGALDGGAPDHHQEQQQFESAVEADVAYLEGRLESFYEPQAPSAVSGSGAAAAAAAAAAASSSPSSAPTDAAANLARGAMRTNLNAMLAAGKNRLAEQRAVDATISADLRTMRTDNGAFTEFYRAVKLGQRETIDAARAVHRGVSGSSGAVSAAAVPRGSPATAREQLQGPAGAPGLSVSEMMSHSATALAGLVPGAAAVDGRRQIGKGGNDLVDVVDDEEELGVLGSLDLGGIFKSSLPPNPFA